MSASVQEEVYEDNENAQCDEEGNGEDVHADCCLD